MATRALLLCGDEKAVHAVTQILDELEVSFEHSGEPPFALKRLATQRFELLIVDCDNAQNATQVFNSARASSLNKASIAIAIVEGKAGVPNAFRLGASLVLTKPVSLEQARNTLRTGIGMTRKDAQDVKTSAPAASTVAPSPVQPVVPAVPHSSAPALTPAPAVTPPAPAAAIPTPVVTPAVASATPVANTPVAPTPLTPVATGPRTSETVVKPASAAVTPASEKAATRPAVAPIAPQEQKPATVADSQAKPMLGVNAGAKAAAASASAATPALKTISTSAASAESETKLKAATSSAKSEADDEDESDSPVLSISDPLAEEEMDELDPMKDYGVPSFGALGNEPFAGGETRKRGGSKFLLIAASVLVFLGAAAGAAWMTQEGFRDFVLAQLGRAQNKYAELRGQPPASEPMQAAPVTPTPAPAPAQPAPVAAVPAATDPNVSSPTTPTGTSTTASSSTAPGSPTQPDPATQPANSPAVTSAAADSTAQKGAAVQSANQDTTPNHVGPNPALVKASASLPSAASAKPVPDLPEVPEDYADDQVIHRVHPAYPKQARAKKMHGTVVLQAIVNKQGKVDSLQTVSGDPLLAQAAADAVKQWRYKPYWHNGETTEFQTRVTVEFKMP